MYEFSKGLCLIFNHKEYKNNRHPVRDGTDKDKNDLKDYFEGIGFIVKSFDNLTEQEIEAKLNQYASDDCEIYFDILVCCVLTHGDNEKLAAFDKNYAMEVIYSPFVGVNCKKLKNKPKIFFIQACQGSKRDRCTEVQYDASRIYSIPKDDDFLFAMCTVPKFMSLRHVNEGAFYIQCLLKVLKEKGNNEDIHQILTTVNREMAYELKYGVEDSYSVFKQMPIYWTSFRDKLYLCKR